MLEIYKVQNGKNEQAFRYTTRFFQKTSAERASSPQSCQLHIILTIHSINKVLLAVTILAYGNESCNGLSRLGSYQLP